MTFFLKGLGMWIEATLDLIMREWSIETKLNSLESASPSLAPLDELVQLHINKIEYA